MRRKTLSILAFVTIFFLASMIYLLKILEYSNFLMIDTWVLKPLGELILNGDNFEISSPFPGLGLNLFYYFISIFHLITNINFFTITRWGALVLLLLTTMSLFILFRRFKDKTPYILLSIFLVIFSTFFIKRGVQVVRENYALLFLYVLIFVFLACKESKKKILLQGILIGAIIASNPITASFLILLGGLIFLINLTSNKKNKKELSHALFYSFLIGIIISSHHLLKLLGSYLWQIKFAEELVVNTRDVAYNYYFLSIDYISIGLIIFGMIGITKIFFYPTSKVSNKFMEKGLILTTLILYIVSFFPISGLFQDRILPYIYLTLAVSFLSYDFIKLKRFIKIILLFLLIITITINAIQFSIWAPYGNLNLEKIKDYMNEDNIKIICWDFDNTPIKYLNYSYNSACDLEKKDLSNLTLQNLRDKYSNKKIVFFISLDNYEKSLKTDLMNELIMFGEWNKIPNSHYEVEI